MVSFLKKLLGKNEYSLSLESRFINGELKTVYMENMAELNKNFEEVLPNNFVLVKEPKQGCSTRQWEWSIGHKTLYCDIHTSMLDAPGKEPGMRIWVFNYNITVWFYKTFGENHTLENISKSIITMLNEKYGIKDVEIREDEESLMPEDDSSVNGIEEREDERYVIPEGVKEIGHLPTSSDKQSETAFFATPSSLLRKWLFNYIVLDSLINELQKEPLWTAGELKIFRDNCKRCLLDDTSNPREFVIVINESSGDISINGRQDLHDIFYMLPTGYKMSNKDRLYRQVKLAMEEAKNRGIYNQIFKEIKN